MRTHIEGARERVAREREAVSEKRAAYDRFRTRIESVSPRAAIADGGDTLVSSAGRTGARPIREAFAETVAPTCEDRATMELLGAELGEEIATALATGGVSPPLYRAIGTEVDRRRAELAAMDGALEAEADSLRRARGVVEPVREWMIEENETALSAYGFEGLRERHARLGAFRADCEGLLADRQTDLGRTTGAQGRAGVRQRDLASYLYEGLPIDHPVLVTAVRLEELCRECQRTVRDHLVRRV
ncbi:DUF7260 family protein [Halalkalicoccus jeotgali]|uniref:DUF7260 domain-containing protein n=1 Tax=Halalkalicoccus jeotgali (strain DSM 18796 / CECT 7217 / JCM 14584 / KCTC 4019 / B3) TaxID=795797 RepID=D8J874_HALJB|nr:hypothetical protein [Halalkalicoccus jeotgali]ADJ14187.1 hypothetical protein HacjB3_03980 [Halalkalicoccus jeotgali B3]ELY34631.1 hypothetical protein C497_15313 [Halalkalicoccus jeotgali B3]